MIGTVVAYGASIFPQQALGTVVMDNVLIVQVVLVTLLAVATAFLTKWQKI